MIFETQRLIIRALKQEDQEAFYLLMSNPKVMHPIPLDIMDRKTSDANLATHINASENSEKKVWAIDSKSGEIFMGIAAFIKNDNGEDEIAYRLREKYWGKGFGTEIARGLIEYGFHGMRLDLITADVNTKNEKSIKILDKFFALDHEFYNAEDKCLDRRYVLNRKDWQKDLQKKF